MEKLKDRMLRRKKDLAEGRYPSLDLYESDPIKWEVLYTRLLGIVNEGRETGRLISASPTVREFGECVFCIFTPEGDAVAFSRGILLHFASFESSIKWMLANDYEEDPGISEGDIFCNNDPQIGGAHSADVATFQPVFYNGQLVAWVGGLTHVMEVGGTEPGGTSPSALSRYDDGLMICAQKVGRNDQFDRQYHLNVQRNTRDGNWWIIDDLAKLGGCTKMKRALVNLIDEYGVDYYLKAVYEMIEEGRRFANNKVKTVLFPGTYRACNFYDVLNAEQPVRFQKNFYVHEPLEMVVTKDGQMTLDYDGTSSAGYHANNASLICVTGLHIYQLLQDVLYDGMFNSGVLQGFKMHFPEGSCINPGMQFACSCWAAAKISAGGTFQKSLARAYFARGFREEGFASKAMTCSVFAGGVDEAGKQFAVANFEMNSSGAAAQSNRDGLDASNSVWNPEANLSDIEPFEPIWPLRWLGRDALIDGGGFGKHRGGAPVASLYVIEPEVQTVESGCFNSGDKVFVSPGIMGGYPAAARYRYTMTDTNFKEAAEQQLPLPHEEGDPADPDFAKLLKGTLNRTPGQSASVQFQRYDIIHQTTGGGGGWGDPIERDPKLAVHELNEGLTLERTLKNVYGVVAKKVSEDEWALDEEATRTLREDIRKKRLARAVPVKDFIARERESILADSFSPIVKEMFNDCFKNSARFLKEYKEFWSLPEAWVGF